MTHRPAFRAITVILLTLLVIWLVAPRLRVAAWLIGTLFCAILLRHSGSLLAAGLGLGNLISAVKSWWWAYILCLVLFASLVSWRSVTGATLAGAASYLAGCVLQQTIYQYLVCAPLTEDFGATTRSQWTSAVLFSAVHFPNPVLMAATLVWGALAWSLFRRRPSLWAVALFQFLLSGIVYLILPIGWHHAFRVGPRYWQLTTLFSPS